MHSILLTIAAAACLFMVSSCASDDSGHDLDPQAELDRWKANEPDAYVVQTCTLGISPPGCVRAVVEQGDVVLLEERIFGSSDFGWEDLTGEAEGQESPLDYMFTRVIAGSEKECRVDDYTYDEADGCIDMYRTDCEGSTQGGRHVVCFQPDTLDETLCDVEPPQ